MLDVFEDDVRTGASAHASFQAWRARNPNGYVLNVHSAKEVMLHKVLCTHFGDVHWSSSDEQKSLTEHPKVVSLDPDELVDYASRTYPGSLRPCGSCRPIAKAAPKANEDWSHEELRAAVAAYVDMQRKTRAREPFKKTDY